MGVTGCSIGEAAPPYYFAILHCKYMGPLGFVFYLSLAGNSFSPAQDGDMFSCLNEFARLEDLNIVGARKLREEKRYLLWSCSVAGIGQTWRTNEFPVDLITDQTQNRRNILAAVSCVSLLDNIKCCTHNDSLGGRVLVH
jgi:hypothetical protein